MPPRKGQSSNVSPPVVMRRVKRKPVSTPTVVEQQTASSSVQAEPPRNRLQQPAPKASPAAPAQPSQPTSSPADEAARAEARQRRYEEALVLLEKIQDRWPETYPKEPQAIRPMKTRIHQDVSAAFPDIPNVRIREALELWYGRFKGAYLQCLKAGQSRYDLAGQICGAVTEEEEAHARTLFKVVSARKREKRRVQEESINAVGRELFSRWPQVFGGPPHTLKPLKHGLEADLAEHLPEVTPVVIKQALARWKKRRAVAYLRAVAAGGKRYDLQGEICGEVTAEEATAAQQQVEILYAEQEAKRQEHGPSAPTSSLSGEQESPETEVSNS